MARAPHPSRTGPPPSFAGGSRLLDRQLDRQRRWRALFPELASRFLTPEGHPQCVLCDRVGPPHDPLAAFRSLDPNGRTITYNAFLWMVPGSAVQRRVERYGLERIWSRAIATEQAEELWCWWCTDCPGPDTPADEAAIMAAIERRAAGAPGWHATPAPAAD